MGLGSAFERVGAETENAPLVWCLVHEGWSRRFPLEEVVFLRQE